MAILVALQEKLVYVPVLPGVSKSYPITPARLRLGYEDVWLTASDGVRLHAWFIKLLPDCRGYQLIDEYDESIDDSTVGGREEKVSPDIA